MTSTSTDPAKLKVHISDPENVHFEGEAVAFSAINQVGPFDVLPTHENFISMVKDKVVVHISKGEKKEIPIQSGVVKVRENQVFVLLGVETV